MNIKPLFITSKKVEKQEIITFCSLPLGTVFNLTTFGDTFIKFITADNKYNTLNLISHRLTWTSNIVQVIPAEATLSIKSLL